MNLAIHLICISYQNNPIISNNSVIDMETLKIEICNEESLENYEDVEYLMDDEEFIEQKKCGEICLYNEIQINRFIILCKFCESTFIDIDEFYAHINSNNHKDNLWVTEDNNNKDPLEFENDNLIISSEINTTYNDESFLSENINEFHPENNSNNQNIEFVNLNEDEEIDLSNEKNEISDNNNKVHKCPYCNLIFTNATKLENHKKIHKNEKSFACKLCGKEFQNRIACEQHEIKHNEEYKCDYCPAKFTTSKSRACHMLRHGEKRFSCSYCDKKFFFNMEKKIHERGHTDEKPHQCKVCNKLFTTSSHLNDHIKIHMGYKPHECQQCDKSFYNKRLLYKHVNVLHTNEKPFVCNICNATFARRRELTLHAKIHDKLEKKND